MVRMLATWRHSGFHVFCGHRISPADDTAMENLARTIIRASFSQERIRYLDQEGKVVYASKDGRTSKCFPALEWLANLSSHIPNRGEQMVRYYGWYSNVSRGKRLKDGSDDGVACILEPLGAEEKTLPIRYVPFDQLLAESDILSIHVPLLESTRGMVGREAIAKMKDGAVIINTARGGVVDETALYRALKSGKLYGAGIDTYAVDPPPAEHPLFGLEQVVLTPHTGGVVVDNVANVTIRVFENMQRVLRGYPITPGDQVA
jgi:hypothetical protein